MFCCVVNTPTVLDEVIVSATKMIVWLSILTFFVLSSSGSVSSASHAVSSAVGSPTTTSRGSVSVALATPSSRTSIAAVLPMSLCSTRPVAF